MGRGTWIRAMASLTKNTVVWARATPQEADTADSPGNREASTCNLSRQSASLKSFSKMVIGQGRCILICLKQTGVGLQCTWLYGVPLEPVILWLHGSVVPVSETTWIRLIFACFWPEVFLCGFQIPLYWNSDRASRSHWRKDYGCQNNIIVFAEHVLSIPVKQEWARLNTQMIVSMPLGFVSHSNFRYLIDLI